MKPSEIREMTLEDLAQKEQDMRKELFNLRFQQATGEIENPMRIRTVRKDLARVLTVISEMQKAAKQSNSDHGNGAEKNSIGR